MDFFPHVWALCGISRIEVEVKVLSPLSTEDNPDPTFLADTSHRLILNHYTPIKG